MKINQSLFDRMERDLERLKEITIELPFLKPTELESVLEERESLEKSINASTKKLMDYSVRTDNGMIAPSLN